MHPRWIISRALIRELLPGLLLATGVATFLLLIRSFFFLADLFVSHQFSGSIVLRVLMLTVPSVAALTLPMGVLFAVLITASRWAADSELIALQSSGVPIGRIVRPLVAVGLALFLLDLWVTLAVLPRSNRELQKLTMQVAFSGARAAIEPHVFIEEFRGQVLFVNRIDAAGTWHGVLLFDQSSGTEDRLVVADTGELFEDPRDGSIWLNLQDATTHLLRPGDPASYQLNPNREMKMLLEAPSVTSNAKRTVGVRETDSAELLHRVKDPKLKTEDRENAAVEIHKRVAIPAACLAFVLVGFPLGARNRRGGRGFAFTAAVGLVVAYYVLLNNGELLAREVGWPPQVGVWLPDAILSLVAIPLLRRISSGYYATAPGVVRVPVPRFFGRLFRARPSGATVRPQVSGNGRRRLFVPTFLGILDRHLVRQCLAFFALVVVAICAVYIAVNFSENVDEIQKNNVAMGVVATFYLFSIPQILHDVLPLTYVIAFLGTAAVLERHNETTALKAAGVSLTRVAAPLFALAALIGLTLFALDESVVQRANRNAQRLEDIIKGRKVARSYRATDRLWLFLPDGRTLVNFLQFDPDTNTLVRPSIYVFDDRFNLRERYMANTATYKDGHWKAEGAWKRTFIAGENPEFVPPHGGITEFPIAVPPSYFGREYRKPSQMSYRELRDYISTLQAAGYRVDRLAVQLQQKLAYPVSLVVLVWIALPFAFKARKRGTVMGVAVAMGLGMGYFALMALTTKLGEVGLISPALGAWTPPVVFALVAMNRHTTLRT
jgi:LPS export ABC transporter permease LptG/LPS export ABC transporter permease LptF